MVMGIAFEYVLILWIKQAQHRKRPNCVLTYGGLPIPTPVFIVELFPRVGFIVTNLRWKSSNVVRFYNKRGTAEQLIKEGKYALNWTRLPCHDFVDNQVRLQLFTLAYNLGNSLRRLALPKPVKKWSLRTLREKLVKIGAKVVRHSRYVAFQMAEVVVPKALFSEILD